MSFPRYPKYKASGVEWLGEVPEEWVVKPIRRVIAAPLSNGIFKKKEEFGEGAMLVNVFDIYRSDFSVDFDSLDRVKCDPIELSCYEVLVGDLFFVRSSLKQDGIAVVAMAGNCPEPAVYECHLIRARPQKQLLDSRFGSFVLNSIVYRSTMIAKAKINTMTTIDQEAILSTQLPIPPLPEQTAIAEFLDRETAKIDGLVAEQRRLMELLKEKITSLVLSSMDLPNTQRLRFGNAACLMSRPVLQQQEESYTRIGLFNRGRGLFHKDASEMDDMGESDFFWVEEGDLIISGQFAWEGAVAMAGKDETGCVVSHRYPVIRGVPGIALTEYLFGLLCTNHGDFLLNEHSRGAAGRNRPLNIRSLMKETIPIPSMQIQETVARAIHSRTVLFQEISTSIDLLQEHRSALISAAVTGQIDVRQPTRN